MILNLEHDQTHHYLILNLPGSRHLHIILGIWVFLSHEVGADVQATMLGGRQLIMSLYETLSHKSGAIVSAQ
jgi:hypothetical protein